MVIIADSLRRLVQYLPGPHPADRAVFLSSASAKYIFIIFFALEKMFKNLLQMWVDGQAYGVPGLFLRYFHIVLSP